MKKFLPEQRRARQERRAILGEELRIREKRSLSLSSGTRKQRKIKVTK
jgi:hypothetical protein